MQQKQKNKTKVFISYSHANILFADDLVTGLEANDIEVKIDRRNLPFAEDFQNELIEMVRWSDTVIFIISPDSIGSEWCQWELDQVKKHNKRLGPVLYEDVPQEHVPDDLSSLHMISFLNTSEFDVQLQKLVKGLNTDIDWIREHTRLGDMARRWDTARRLGTQVLRGKELENAEQWLSTRPHEAPEPTESHYKYIRHSRKATIRRQRMWLGGAFVGMFLFAVIGSFAWWQKQEADEQRIIAQKNEKNAISSQKKTKRALVFAREQRDKAYTTQSLFLADMAQKQTDSGDAVTGILLALEALPDKNKNRPYVSQAEISLYHAIHSRREFRVLHGNTYFVKNIKFSPDGKYLVLICSDNNVRVLSAKTFDEVVTLRGHTSSMNTLSFSPDGKYIVTPSWDKTARIWKIPSGKVQAILVGHEKGVTDAVFSPNGKHILTQSGDKTARIWNVKTGKQLFTLPFKKSSNKLAFFSPNGKWVVTAAAGQNIDIWNTETGHLQKTFNDIKDKVPQIVFFSPNNSQLALHNQRGDIRVLNTRNWREMYVLSGHKHDVASAHFSPDGLTVTTIGMFDKRAYVWNAQTGNKISILEREEVDDSVSKFVYNRDSSRVVTLVNNIAYIWDIKTRKSLAVLRGHTDTITSVSYSKNGQFIITISNDNSVRIWKANSGELVAALKGHIANQKDYFSLIRKAILSSDNKWLVTLSELDNTARIWNVGRYLEVKILKGHNTRISSISISNNNQAILSTSLENKALLWNLKNEELIEIRLCNGQVSSALFGSKDKNIALFCSGNRIKIIPPSSDHNKSVIIGRGDGSKISSFSPNGKYISTINKKKAYIWDVVTGQLITTLKGHNHHLNSIQFSPNGKLVVTTSLDKTARIWDILSGKQQAIFPHKTWVGSASFSPNGKLIVTSSWDKVIRVWDYSKNKVVKSFKGHDQMVLDVSFSRDGKQLLSSSSDKTARIWDYSTRNIVAILKGHKKSVSAALYSPNGKYVVTSSDDKTIRIWRVFPTTKKLIKYSKSTVPRCLSQKQRKQFFLSTFPPAWCIKMKKWPYHTQKWKNSLDAMKKRKSFVPLPTQSL